MRCMAESEGANEMEMKGMGGSEETRNRKQKINPLDDMKWSE